MDKPLNIEHEGRDNDDPLRSPPNLRHLKAFLEVAEVRGVNRAAERLHVSQPAVTQAIARLEQIFGVELFTRHQTGMYLTTFGELLRVRLADAFAALSDGAGRAAAAALTQAVSADPARFVTASQIGALIALMQTMDFQSASDALRISVASLHRSLRGLEEQLGASLVVRDGRGMRFSEGGAALARQAKLAVRQLELAHEDINWARGINRGRLTIGALPLTLSRIAPKALVTVATRHPGLRVRLMEGSYRVLLQALREGDIDILVGALRNPAPAPDVVEETLFTETLCVVARADHPLAGARGIELPQLARCPWVVPREGSPARKQFERLMREARADPPLKLEVASHISVRTILLESDALALLSREQIRYEEQLGQLAILSVDWDQAPRAIGYTVRANWRPTPAQGELIEALRDICARR